MKNNEIPMNRFLLVTVTVVCVALIPGNITAAPKTDSVTLTPAGEKLQARYAAMLSNLQAEIQKVLPPMDERKKAAFQEAREMVKKATADANAAKRSLEKLQSAKALVEHAKNKWIAGAEKGIAAAQAALKNATTNAERVAAQKELAKWQANKEDGIKALKERQEAWEKLKNDEPKLILADQNAQATLARAQTNEFNAAQALLAELEPFLSNDKLDTALVKCVVLTEATPRGLAEFAQQGREQESLVEQLLADSALMKQMLEAGGAKAGKYGPAMQIYTAIQKNTPHAKNGILQRLALGTSLEHAVPIAQRNRADQPGAAPVVDPVKRYLHYEKAYFDGELDPAFPNMTAWECRYITNADAPDHVLAWGRQMLRNYRPDHVRNPDYGWRYSGIVRTDVAYRHSHEYKDTDSLEFYQNVLKNGGLCGRRAFFGRFIVRAFGLPVWGVTQKAHAALGRWTPSGWVVNLGANWQHSWFEGRSGSDFLLETQARKSPQDYQKVLRAQWIGVALGEQKYDSMKDNTGGLWNMLALFQKKAIVAATKPSHLDALGQELAEANESEATKTTAIVKATVTDADKTIRIASNGVITIPAAACAGSVQLMKSFPDGLQAVCGGTFTCDIETPHPGRYALTARVVNVHDEEQIQLTLNDSKTSIVVVIPFTCGQWEQTKPAEITLARGKNTLHFAKPTHGFALKDITLTPLAIETK